MGSRGRWAAALVAVAFVLGVAVAGVGWMLAGGDDGAGTIVGRANIVGALAGVLAVVAVAAGALRWAARGPAGASLSDPAVLAAAADQLAVNMTATWQEQVRRRRIVTPAPATVRWRWAEPDLASPRDAAGGLLRARRVALFLDGLDEMAEPARARALERLREEAGGLCVVMTSRTDQFRAAIAAGRLDNAAVIELRPVRPRASCAYLLRDQASPQRARWQHVCAHLEAHPDSVAARALDNPLTLSLARDTYQRDDPAALLDQARYPTVESLRSHLLTRVLALAYPDQREREQATRWLAWLAYHMSGSRDLRWWQIPT